jgi:Cu/Ag efflux protein CusF
MQRSKTRMRIAAAMAAAVLMAACGGMQDEKAAPAAGQSAQPAQTAQTTEANQAKRYHLTGKIVAVKAPENALTIDGQDVPGFMSAMTMDYSVKSAQSLEGLNAGDEISADIVVPEGGTAYLENIMVTKKAG